MKLWTAKILSALLTFFIGAGAVAFYKHLPARVDAKPLPNWNAAEIPLPELTLAGSPEESTYPQYGALSPYEVKRLIEAGKRAVAEGAADKVDLDAIWKRLGIPLGKDQFLNFCDANCRTDIFRLELDGKPGAETVLRVHWSGLFESRFLIYKEIPRLRVAGTSWVLLGALDYYSWWDEPELRVITAGNQRWLAIECISGHGSGYGAYEEDWYEINDSGVKKVLTYPKSIFVGALHDVFPGVESETRIFKVGFENGLTRVVLQFTNSYSAGMKTDSSWKVYPLFTARPKVSFVKPPGASEFVFDAAESDLPKSEFENFYRFGDGYNWKDFLKYNYRELWQLTSGRDAKRREWLRNFLSEFDASIEREALQKALDKDEQ